MCSMGGCPSGASSQTLALLASGIGTAGAATMTARKPASARRPLLSTRDLRQRPFVKLDIELGHPPPPLRRRPRASLRCQAVDPSAASSPARPRCRIRTRVSFAARSRPPAASAEPLDVLEAFLLFALPTPPSELALGAVDAAADCLDVVIAGRRRLVPQSPGLLSSSRRGGTTGAGSFPSADGSPSLDSDAVLGPMAAVLWKVSPLLASWLASAAAQRLLDQLVPTGAAVLELGCGVSPLVGIALAARAALYVLSDQSYVRRLMARALEANGAADGPLCFRPFDWETDQLTAELAAPATSFDLVLACDCVYNEALVEPFVQACVDACMLRRRDGEVDGEAADDNDHRRPPCLCLVAQQLRTHQVFLSWLAAFHRAFHVWRMPPELLPDSLRPTAGFVIHLGLLRQHPLS